MNIQLDGCIYSPPQGLPPPATVTTNAARLAEFLPALVDKAFSIKFFIVILYFSRKYSFIESRNLTKE